MARKGETRYLPDLRRPRRASSGDARRDAPRRVVRPTRRRWSVRRAAAGVALRRPGLAPRRREPGPVERPGPRAVPHAPEPGRGARASERRGAGDAPSPDGRAVTGSEAAPPVPALARGSRPLPGDAPLVRGHGRRVPRLAGRPRRGLAAPRAARRSVPTSPSCRWATRGPPSPSGWPPCAPSTATARDRGWRPATRGAPSPRRACPAACPGSSRWSRSRRCSRSSTTTWSAAADGTSRTGRHDPDLARAIALRDRALVETAYAAGLRISELAAADLGSLDLRRGEIRVMGKGRKERIGLLGASRPRGADGAISTRRRPVLDARRDPLGGEPAEVFLNHRGGPLGVRGLRMRLDRLRRLAGLPEGVSPHTLRHSLRHAPARGGRGPARGPGAAGPREPRHHAGVHARVAGAPAGRLPPGAPAGTGHLMDDPDVLTGVVADEEPAPAPGRRRRGVARGRLVGAVPGPRRAHRHRDVPAVAGAGIRPDHRLRGGVPGPGRSWTRSTRPSGSRTSCSSSSPPEPCRRR